MSCLDCRPSLDMLVINTLAASDYVLILAQAYYLAAEDMAELVGTVQSIKRQINPRLKIGGVFLTMANETNFRKDIVTTVKDDVTFEELGVDRLFVDGAHYYKNLAAFSKMRNVGGINPATCI